MCQFPKNIKQQLFSTLIIRNVLNVYVNIRNAKKYIANIRMISDRSCDTEDWNNDAENSALHHRNK